MKLEVLGLFAGLKRATGVARLTAGWASGLSAQTLGLGRFRPVRGRRARTVAAVLSGGVAQTTHLLLQLPGVVHQFVQVSLAPIPELRPALNDRVLGAHRSLKDRGKCPCCLLYTSPSP